MEGKTARGASSPAKPAFTSPEPLSHTRAVVSSSSHIFARLQRGLRAEESGVAALSAYRDGLLGVPGRGDRAEGGWRKGTPATSLPLGQTKRGWEDTAGIGSRRAWSRGEEPPRLPGRGLARCLRCKEGQSPLTRSSPVLYIFAFSQTVSPLGPHQHPHSCPCPSWRKKRARAGTPNNARPSSSDFPGQKKLESNRKVCTLKNGIAGAAGAARARGPGSEAGPGPDAG